MRTILITGSAGFIGHHLALLMLREGWRVHGFDAMNDYYDVQMKRDRVAELNQHEHFSATEGLLEGGTLFADTCAAYRPDVIVHLAGQAGVRYSLENPRAYVEANLVGSFNVLEAAKAQGVDHLLMASTSSVYGANTEMPFAETDKADTPLTFYAASKKANEAMAHSYAHLWDLPVTMFRFFTVYGPWGRPDMAPHKFVDAILAGRPIDIYNHGDMYRDFTYVEDLARAIVLLIDAVPQRPADPGDIAPGDSLSPAAPYRVVNIGNSDKVRLTDFIAAIERALGVEARRNYMEMQKGDVPATWADAGLLQRLTGYRPETGLDEGLARFVAWFRDYYGC